MLANTFLSVLALVSLLVCCRCGRRLTALIHEMSPRGFWMRSTLGTQKRWMPCCLNAEGDDVRYYQGWAQGAQYEVVSRPPCDVLESGNSLALVTCSVTVNDDFGRALGYRATDTFRLTIANERVLLHRSRAMTRRFSPRCLTGFSGKGLMFYRAHVI